MSSPPAGLLDTLMDRLLTTTAANSVLAGDRLRTAADALARRCVQHGLLAYAADSTGERILGAALARHDDLIAAATWMRLDGYRIMLVSGHLVGGSGLAEKAQLMTSLGATHVEAAVLGGLDLDVPGCAPVTALPA